MSLRGKILALMARTVYNKRKQEAVNDVGIEYELKFRASREKMQAVLSEFSGANQHFDMETTYYDTPSGALSARMFTMRRRMVNGESICTLKTPAKGHGRMEIEIPCQDIASALESFYAQGAPAELPELVKEGLIPVCGAKFHRIAIAVTYGDCRLELALDEGVLTGGGKALPLCEIEVELKSGETEGADLFALELASKYHLTPETKSKFRRALDLCRGESV